MIEIMVVIFIIGLLASVVGPGLVKMMGRGSESSTKANLAALKTAVLNFKMDIGRFPSRDEGLEVLINQPKDKGIQARWRGPYLEGVTELPMDAWSRPFIYNCPPVKFKASGKYQSFEIFSYGEGGEEGATEQSIIDVGA